MAATTLTFILLGLLATLAPSISSPLPQDGSSVSLQSTDKDVVYVEAGGEEEEKPAGYQYQELNAFDGSYKFGFEGEDGTFRVEQRLGSGQLRGYAGTRTPDGGLVDAFRYQYDGVKFSQEPFTAEQVPSILRNAAGPEALPQLIKDLQLFPEYFP